MKLGLLFLAHGGVSGAHEPLETMHIFGYMSIFFWEKAHSSQILTGVHRAQNIKNVKKRDVPHRWYPHGLRSCSPKFRMSEQTGRKSIVK